MAETIDTLKYKTARLREMLDVALVWVRVAECGCEGDFRCMRCKLLDEVAAEPGVTNV